MIKTADIFLVLLTFGILAWGLRRRFRLWTVGIPEKRDDNIGKRLTTFLTEGIFHGRILQDLYPGILHLLMFVGFLVPLAIIILAQVPFTLPSLIARPLSLILDLIGLGLLLAVLLVLVRRYVTRPGRLDNQADDLYVLLLLLAIVSTGMVMEGLRLTVIGRDVKAWAPVGRLAAALINTAGLENTTKSLMAMIVFRIHLVLVLVFIGSVPFTKLFHIISSPLSMIFRPTTPKGTLSFMDLEDEEAESFGVSKIQEFGWKQLMDLDACMQCGRCQDHCPAYRTQKPLSPKTLILDLKSHLHRRGPQILDARRGRIELDETSSMVGNVISEDVLWACTTCRSCMEHCPVHIEHMPKIIDMRRYQVLMESKFPEELTLCFKNLERNSNPWGLSYESRSEWVEELDIPIMAELAGETVDLLFYVGCIRSYDDRNKKVTKAITRLLNHLGVRFAILGMEEGCCGDPARRAGNEYLFQNLAQKNIETFTRYKVDRIMTSCPHCYNTLKNEYFQLGFSCEVIHHTQFLEESLRSKRLELAHSLPQSFTYHDPCYLGRYHGLYQAPRDILRSVSSLEILEMKRSRTDSFCCGAGGGWMWMDEKIGKRINIERLEEAMKTGAGGIATACPFCMTMFSDAIKDKDKEQELSVLDIAELVEKAVFGDSARRQI